MYRALLRPLLFRLGAETAHELAILGLAGLGLVPGLPAALRRLVRPSRRSLQIRVAGLDFPNPVGLAAGMDKDAQAVAGFFALGFGALELGTVTPRPQPGNPRPRAFRIPEREALINRMGFNNRGAEAMGRRLERTRWRPGLLGVNIGKNKDTPLERAVDDYLAAARRLGPLADYVALNLSSPNTPGLRSLQAPAVLGGLLRSVRQEVRGRPMFLKIAPDLTDEEIDEVVQVALDSGTDALICTNTTLARPFEHPVAAEAGGLSGRPLTARATAVVRRAFRAGQGRLPIIGVGGIFDAQDAWEKICAGASLIQLYTGFIYGGPGLVREVLDGLETRLAAAGLDTLAKAVGRDA
jgi:dihydroorotate dehydrogenase